MAHGYYQGHISIPHSFVYICPQLCSSQPRMNLIFCLLTHFLIHAAEFTEGHHIIRKIAFTLYSCSTTPNSTLLGSECYCILLRSSASYSTQSSPASSKIPYFTHIHSSGTYLVFYMGRKREATWQ